MPPVNLRQPRASDFTAEGIANFQDMWRELVTQVNNLTGVHGPIKLLADVDLGGNRVKNSGTAQSSTDLLTQQAADPMYSTSTQQSAMEAVGKKMLQTTRRLNDGTQQHSISSDLNTQGSVPPSNITGSLTYTTVSGASITWTWSGIIVQLADLSYVAIQNGSLTVTGLTNALYSFYPYYDTKLGLLVFVPDNTNGHGAPPVGFLSANTAAAQMQTADGHIALTSGATTATINGGSGGASLRTR